MSKLRFVIHSGPESLDVADDDLRPRRAKHACQACQVKKVKCSGGSPCKMCEKKEIKCVYADQSPVTKKRKIRTDSTTIKAASATVPERIEPIEEANVNEYENGTTRPSGKKVVQVKTTRQPYFRWLGPTAVAPPKDGTSFRLLSVNLRSNETDIGESAERKNIKIQRLAPSTPQSSSSSSTKHALYTSPLQGASSSVSDHDTIPSLPDKSLYKLFYTSMANFLPYIPEDEFERRLAEGLVSDCLLFAMGAIGEKLRPEVLATAAAAAAGEAPTTPISTGMFDKYVDAAKKLVLPHLASPNVEYVYTLLLISYAEFADDRDSGLWAWSGMAIRMCYDLGLHKESTSEHTIDNEVGRRVFWSIVCLDRIISCGTGRNVTIPDDDIEYELETTNLPVSGRTDPFPYLCRLFIIVGKISNYLNAFAAKKAKSSSSSSTTPQQQQTDTADGSSPSITPEMWTVFEIFTQFQQDVSDFYTNLPPDLLFDVQNFQSYSQANCSQVFFLLHIWNQATVLATHHPSLVYPRSSLDVMGLISNPHADVTGSGAVSISDMVAFADLIDPKSFMANPFLAQAILMAASASLTLWYSHPQVQTNGTLQRTYATCRNILCRMQKVWRGISWHYRSLVSLAASEPDVDLSVNPKGTITTRDGGVVRKASLDESTKRWLAAQVKSDNSNDIYGLFIAGSTTDSEPSQPHSDLSFLSNLRDDTQVNDRISQFEDLAPVDIVADTTSAFSATMPLVAEDPDTFRGFLQRNLDLDEYLQPPNFA